MVYRGNISTIWDVKFAPKGYFFACGSSDCTAKLYVTDKITPIRIFLGHTSDVTLIEFLNNNMQIATSGFDTYIRLILK